VVVPKGSHAITFLYQPKSFSNGVIVSIISSVVAFIFILKIKRYET